MRKVYVFQRINHFVCSAVLAVLIGCTMSSSYVPVQAKLAVKKGKSKKKRKQVKVTTINVGKSKIISVKYTSKVKWSTANKKVVTVKSVGKTKVKITGAKAGSTTVSGKAGSHKWIFKVNVKGNDSRKKAKLTVITGLRNGGTITFDEPGVSDGTTDITVYVNNKSVSEKDIKFSLSNTNILHIKPVFTGDGIAECELIPCKEGTSTFTITAPGYSKSYKLNVNGSAAYERAKGFIAKVNASGLDDAHKAFVTAKWLEKLVTYGEPEKYTGYEATIIEGKGVCGDYAGTYEWLLKLENIKSRYISTGEIGDHTWNQICINGKWYNVDVTFNDIGDTVYAKYFMKSDSYSHDGENHPFADYKAHALKYRVSKDEYPVTATATDYDNYDWSSFAESEKFKELINN